MPKETIFISSVQKEFANERQALAAYIREDELLKLFFEPYLFEEEDNKTFSVTLWRPSAMATAHDTAHDTAHEQKFFDIENMPHRLLWVLENEMSRSEIMDKLELTHRTNFNTNYLDPAMDKGWIEMTIPDKPQSKKQKYRLTKAGKSELEKMKHEY